MMKIEASLDIRLSIRKCGRAPPSSDQYTLATTIRCSTHGCRLPGVVIPGVVNDQDNRSRPEDN